MAEQVETVMLEQLCWHPCMGTLSAADDGLVRLFRFHSFSEVLMKAILSMALVLGGCGLAGAAYQVDPVGTWKCEYEIGGMKLTATLTIKKDGDKLAGTMIWPDQ